MPVTSRFMASRPPSLTTATLRSHLEATNKETALPFYPSRLAASAVGAVLAGLGASSVSAPAIAAREALSNAIASLAAASGTARSLAATRHAASLAIVTCSKVIHDAEEVRCELVRAVPDALLHGASSSATLCTSPNAQRQSSAASEAVGCLLLEAPEGSFATAWDDTGDALYAAKWLQEQMPIAQAIIMATVPGQEESALNAIQSVFPGVAIYGGSAADATSWVTMSHLGSAKHGISLVGIGVHVGFGVADTVPTDDTDFSRDLVEVYDAAMLAGDLQRATAGILTCRGRVIDFSCAENFRERVGDLPILGVSCVDSNRSRDSGSSIGMMLFGERYPPNMCSAEDETGSTSTACPNSPATDDSPAKGVEEL